MKIQRVLLAIAFTTTLITASGAMAYNAGYILQKPDVLITSQPMKVITQSKSSYSKSIDRGNRSSHHQETRLNIDVADLDQPHQLEIQADTDTRLSGQIVIEGEVTQHFNQSVVRLDLAPYLSAGTNKIEISGTYRPVNANIQLTFVSPHTTVVQQTSGTGVIRQTLVMIAQ